MEAVAAEGRWIATEAPIDRPPRRERFKEAIEGGRGTHLAAFADDELVGALGIELAPYGVADLGMFVAADWRGRGVGSALMVTAIDWARSAGAHKIALQLWPDNDAARALYEKFGFEQEGFLRRHYRRQSGEIRDAVVMGLLL